VGGRGKGERFRGPFGQYICQEKGFALHHRAKLGQEGNRRGAGNWEVINEGRLLTKVKISHQWDQ